MKYTAKNKLLVPLVLSAGLVGAFARFILYRFTPDAMGLLPKYHPLDLLCWLLSAAVILCTGAVILKLKDSKDFTRSFPRKTGLLGPAVTAAAGLLVTLLQGLQLSTKLHLVWLLLGFLSVPGLIVIGCQRTKGNIPTSWAYSLLCLFYAVHLICCYQSWSGNPQIPDYSFQLLACVFLILAAYQRSAFSAALGSRRMHLICSLLAGYFCTLCCVGCDFPWLYLTSGGFFLCDLTFQSKHH